MKKIAALFLSVLLVTFLVTQSGASFPKGIPSEVDIKVNQTTSLEIRESKLASLLEREIELSKKFGGAYMGEDGSLVINVNEEDSRFDIKGSKQRVVKNSYEKLSKVYKDLGLHARGHLKGLMPITTIHISNKDNKVVVTLREKNEEAIKWLGTQVDLDTVIFIEEDSEIVLASGHVEEVPATELQFVSPTSVTNIRAQHSVAAPPLSGPSSIGFRARRLVNGYWQYGFVSTFHGQALQGQSVNVNIGPWSPPTWVNGAGMLREQVFENGVDACFISLNSNFAFPEKKFRNGDTYVGMWERVVENMFVYGYGSRSGLRSGRVTAESVDVPGIPQLTGVVETDHYADSGDSGSAVTWRLEEGSEPGQNYITGMVVAIKRVGGVPVRTYFVRVNRILTTLGISDW